MTKYKKWFEIGREFLYSLLFPPRCPICDEILTPEELEKGIHLACEYKLYPVEGAVCMHCGRPLGHVNSYKNIKLNQTQSFVKKEDKTDDMPIHLRPESAYEYCMECRRKGYVQKASYYMSKKLQEDKNNKSSIMQAKALYVYKGAIKKTMYRLKYANKREYAHFFARKAIKKYGDWIKAAHIEVIVPVPMYLPKQKQRGYNQAETFAEELSHFTGIPVEKRAVFRIKDTTPQKELSDMERKNNLENAFQKGESIVQYSHILVVDDIYTTGHTAEAVAKELRKQGECQIYLLCICIGGNS